MVSSDVPLNIPPLLPAVLPPEFVSAVQLVLFPSKAWRR